MTTGTGQPADLVAAPALTVDEVLAVAACPLCGPTVLQCAHDVARLRAAVRAAQAATDRLTRRALG